MNQPLGLVPHGPIGQAITEEVWKEPVVKYTPLHNPELLDMIKSIPPNVFQDFNKDHQYLIKIVEGCLTGQVDKQWEHMKLGSIVQSRWGM